MDAGCNNKGLQGTFQNGLNDQLKDELASHEEPTDFDSLVFVAIKIDNQLCTCRRERSGSLLLPVVLQFP